MALNLWSPKTLFRRMRDDRMDTIPSFFLDRFYPQTFFSSDREILISELPAQGRKLAPFVLPTEQGKPMAEFKGETMKALTPPYIKPKDAVRPEDARNPLPEEIFNGPLTLEQRYNRRVGEIQDQHVRGIRMQEAWMGARAIIDGQITVKYQNDQGAAHPEVTIQFGRAGNQTVVLAGPTYWDDVDYPILDDIMTWADRMAAAKYGVYPSTLLVGATVAKVFRKNRQIIAEMDTTVRGNSVQMQTGIVRGPDARTPLVYLGTVGAGIEVWSYRDYVENANGDLVDILDPRDVLLFGEGVDGVRAYGAIYDVDAIEGGSVSVDIFPKMFKTEDPGERYVMHQSSPLPIPIFPNRTLKARVLL